MKWKISKFRGPTFTGGNRKEEIEKGRNYQEIRSLSELRSVFLGEKCLPQPSILTEKPHNKAYSGEISEYWK